jgi:hypothetical protein
VIVPGRRFPDYLAVMCGLIRRYGAHEPTITHALLRLLGNCAAVAGEDPERRAAIEEQARIIIADAEREIAQPVGLAFPHAEAEAVRQVLARARPASPAPAARPQQPRPRQHRAETHHRREPGARCQSGLFLAAFPAGSRLVVRCAGKPGRRRS